MIIIHFSDQTKLIDLEEMAKTMAKGKWGASASDVSINKWIWITPGYLKKLCTITILFFVQFWVRWMVFYVHGSLMITMSFDLNKNCTACAKFLCQPCGWLSLFSVYLYPNQQSYTIQHELHVACIQINIPLIFCLFSQQFFGPQLILLILQRSIRITSL